MTATMRVALLIAEFLVTLVELYARTTDDERDDVAAAKMRETISAVVDLLHAPPDTPTEPTT